MSKPKPHGPVGEHFMRHHYGAAKAAPQPPLKMSLPPLPPLVMAETAQKLLLEWGAAVCKAALEEAAKVCDEHAKRTFPHASENSGIYHAQADWAECIAKSIRTLKEKQ